ncbi:unnamed protein product (macronuclear) [Paramecium tetraurelia]|uniref:Uncharacterized protein n=1 Tax=Paramecium tetraurelia TaxID=5888 RepID=A0CQR0_PARTE|nr:uncharacterized protein GSPATT00009475001 [Paramecium tetraurelia]CAK73127.1 unnamed protein product [Paramecium tetraurelia]|eukprot:XP_001440524.1 hypothetical protein (macronuclear) [Paramecium tetraurelia strain d4-2]
MPNSNETIIFNSDYTIRIYASNKISLVFKLKFILYLKESFYINGNSLKINIFCNFSLQQAPLEDIYRLVYKLYGLNSIKLLFLNKLKKLRVHKQNYKCAHSLMLSEYQAYGSQQWLCLSTRAKEKEQRR